MTDAEPTLETEALLLIVVGASLRAETEDRPLGDRLRERILRWQDALDPEDEPLQPIVCTDLWYVNDRPLWSRPTIAIGEPSRNAGSAMLARQAPAAFVIDDTLRIHLDQELIDLQATVWGVNHSTTVSAVDLFAERYLDDFLRAAHSLG